MTKSKPKIVAAMSGGVDSTVAAAIYLEKGFEVIGVTLRLKPESTQTGPSACCSLEMEKQVSSVAEKLGIEHLFLNARERFTEKVLKKSWNEYAHARTPNPCALCNRYLKFGTLLDYALERNAEGIITGHHSKIIHSPGKPAKLIRGNDPVKDQTYFLFALTQEQLSKTFFPIGDMLKSEVREYARKLEMPNADNKESQDACFSVQGEVFAETLRKFFDDKPRYGFFIAPNGKKLTRHNGIHNYTIGQRKGLGVALGVPAYVSKIDYDSGDVFLTVDEENLREDSLIAEDINWQQEEFSEKTFEADVQVRYRSRPVKATVTPDPEKNQVSIKFHDKLRAITPGQAAVFYQDNLLIGGGWIR